MVSERRGFRSQGQSYHIDNGQDTGPVSELGRGRREVLVQRNASEAESDVGGKVANKEEQLQAGGQRTHVDGRAQLDLPVVSLP